MAKIQNISGIHSTLGFPEFDILENYRKSFHESELGRLHSLFSFDCMVKSAGLSDRRLGRRNRFSPSAKIALMVLKAYTGFSDDFWTSEPERYPRGYYGFSTRIRTHIFLGQRVRFNAHTIPLPHKAT